MNHQVEELLAELIAIPSFSPEDAERAGEGGEARLADFLEGFLTRRGFACRQAFVEPGRPNLVAVCGPEQPKRTVLFEAHLDTVGVRNMSIPPFQATVRDGRMYGRGACDMKGAMAAFLAVLDAPLLERLTRAGCRIVFVGCMGEEHGNTGAIRLAQGDLRADWGVILEPTELEIVHAHKGTLWLEVELRGRAAHGSTPQLGVNAVEAAGAFMDRLRRGLQTRRELRNHPVLGRPTLNIGSIQGGTAVNVVPAECRVKLDFRVLPEEQPAELLAALQAELEQMTAQRLIVGHALHGLKDAPAFAMPPDCALVEGLAAALRQAGCADRRAGAGWYSDAGPLSGICREVAVFGPGSIRQAHTADEFIELAELHRGAAVMRRFLEQLAGPVA